MPVRDVITRSPHRRAGFVACPWFQSSPIEYESLLERDFIRLALLDLKSHAIEHQPFFIDLNELGEYTPDFLLLKKGRKVVVEVKPDEHAENERNRPRLARARTILRPAGYEFIVATEKEIRSNGRHNRAAILLRHARSHLNPDKVSLLKSHAARFPSGIPIGALAASTGLPVSTVLHVIGRRGLRINSELDFSDSRLVFPIGGENAGLCA